MKEVKVTYKKMGAEFELMAKVKNGQVMVSKSDYEVMDKAMEAKIVESKIDDVISDCRYDGNVIGTYEIMDICREFYTTKYEVII